MKLLQLDVEEAGIRLSATQKEMDRARQLVAKNVMSTTEQRKAETEHAVSEIAVKRAELHLAPYAAMENEMFELNPENFDAQQLLKDPLEEPSDPGTRR